MLFEDEAYAAELKEIATQRVHTFPNVEGTDDPRAEATILHTAFDKTGDYLLACSTTGRLAIWRMSLYLQQPIKVVNDDEPPCDWTRRRPRATLPQNHCRSHRLRQQVLAGLPCLSLQVSGRALNRIVFADGRALQPARQELLLLGGDEGIFIWDWAIIRSQLQRDPGLTGEWMEDLKGPVAHLKAFPHLQAWFPPPTECHDLCVSPVNSSIIYSVGGDSIIRAWDLERRQVVHELVGGHTGYLHMIRSASRQRLVSCAEGGQVAVWQWSQRGSEATEVPQLVCRIDAWKGNKSGEVDEGESSLQTARWVAALDVDETGDWVVCGGGVEWGTSASRNSKFGFVSLIHLPTQRVTDAASTSTFVQDVQFCGTDRIISVGQEPWVTHWQRGKKLVELRRVQSTVPSIFTFSIGKAPAQIKGISCYGGSSDVINVFIYAETGSLGLKFR